MTLVRIGALPDDPLVAAERFYRSVLPEITPEITPGTTLGTGSGDQAITLLFAPADHTHRGWRLAAVQGLARRWAPLRVNALAGADDTAILAAQAYLARAPGVTGQYLPLAEPDPPPRLDG